MPYREVTTRDWLKTGLFIALTIATVVVTWVLVVPLGAGGMVAWFAMSVASVYLLIRWHANTTAYRCPDCGHEFEISVLTDWVSPHWHGRKLLRCPGCGTRGWATILIQADS